MRLEKREVTLNEKDTLSDMLFFENNLARAYRDAAEKTDRKEERCTLLEHAEGLEESINKLQMLLEKAPKM